MFIKNSKKIQTIAIIFFILIILLLFIPVRQSVLAPASVIAKDPVVITATLGGVIAKVHVKPNQPVQQEHLLVTMNQSELEKSNRLINNELDLLNTKYLEAVQEGFRSKQSRSNINIIKAKMKRLELEVEHNKSLMERAHVLSPTNGIVVFSNAEEIIGKPMQTGEKIMLIADPNNTQLEILLPVSRAIELQLGAPIKFYTDIDPGSPVDAKITQIAYQAELSKGYVLVFRVMATFDNSAIIPPLGSQGRAKLFGKKVSLFSYLLRKPLTSIRQYIGW